MAVPFIYLQDTESDEEDNFNLSQAAPPNAELERLDNSGSFGDDGDNKCKFRIGFGGGQVNSALDLGGVK